MHLFTSKHSKDQKDSMNGPTGFLHRLGRDAYADWAIIFVVTVLIIVVVIFFGFLTFENALTRLDANPSPTASASVKFSASRLSDLLSKFDARAAEHAKLLKSYDGPVDPSL